MILTMDGACYPVVDRADEFGAEGPIPNPPVPEQPGAIVAESEPIPQGYPAGGVTYCCEGQGPNLLDGSEGVAYTAGMPVYPKGIGSISGAN